MAVTAARAAAAFPRRLRPGRVLRRRAVIASELGALAVLAVVGAAIPQRGAAGPPTPGWAAALGLDHVFASWPFVAVVTACTASLAVVTWDLLGRLPREWRRRPTPGRLLAAPHRTVFTRPAGGGRTWVRRHGRLGLAGSPLLHLGLLLVAIAGMLRALLGAGGVVDLLEGETLRPVSSAWAAQWPGALGRSFALRRPLTLRRVHAEYGEGGRLRALEAVVSVAGRQRRLAINRPLHLGSRTVWLDQRHGVAALLEVGSRRLAVLAEHRPGAAASGRARLGGGSELRVRVAPSGVAALRLLRDGVAVWVGSLAPGESAFVPGLGRVTHRGVRPWVRLLGGQDPFLVLAWLGMGLVVLGVTLLFAVVPADVAVVVEPQGDVERVTVAVWPRRFVPLGATLLERIAARERACTDA